MYVGNDQKIAALLAAGIGMGKKNKFRAVAHVVGGVSWASRGVFFIMLRSALKAGSILSLSS